ncbi:hypothetical protein PYCC9005_001499 [Savitreella phatthalungensis]
MLRSGFRSRIQPCVGRSIARGITLGPPSIGPSNPVQEDPREDESSKSNDSTGSRVLESGLTTLASLILLAAGGYSYHKYYKWLVLHKIEKSFGPGDPALRFHHNRHTTRDASALDHHFVLRDEQYEIDAMVRGERAGSYYLIIGEKGNGKKGMLLNAMHAVEGENVSIMDVHPDVEVFRIRLGKVLDYEFTEDFIGGLFSIKGQRDAGPLLDIERAFNKLEKVAVRHLTRKGADHRPLVLIFNNMHLLRNDPEGNDLLELLQQRAESFASAGLATFIFNSDEYWVFERMKQNARRMELLPVHDLPKNRALAAFARYRTLLHNGEAPTQEQLDLVWHACGGRLSFLAKVAKAPSIEKRCAQYLRQEKTWLLSQSALIPDFDDDVLDDGKWQAGTFSLAQALVEEEKRRGGDDEGDRLVSLPLHECRRIATRADFMEKLDALNLLTIDAAANVRADSRAMMAAFREICAEDNFQDMLDNVKDRCDAVESLHRTRELVFKGIDEDPGRGNVRVWYERYSGEPGQSRVDAGDTKTQAQGADEEDEEDPFVQASRRED